MPIERVRVCAERPVKSRGDYVLYWMTAARRSRFNYALQWAVSWSRRLDRPLVVLEALRAGYRHASDRLHRFVIEGMADNQRRLAERPVLYYPYVETRVDAGKGLLAALAERACVVVTDDFPGFFLPRMLAAAARRIDARLEAVDGNGLVPVRAVARAYASAGAFRRRLQTDLAAHLAAGPVADPLDGRLPTPDALPASVLARWPPGLPADLASLPIDHAVPPVAERPGGATAGQAALAAFLPHLDDYPRARRDPSAGRTSGLSAYLHFGHLSAHAVFAAVVEREQGWSPRGLVEVGARRSDPAWRLRPAAGAFVDQLLTWRELALNAAVFTPRYDAWSSLPRWARATLEEHASDPRPRRYGQRDLERAQTDDPVWNAAQCQLLRQGQIHGYLRMLWGKRTLHWVRSPRRALRILLDLNDRWALDGRDPNSVAGVFWCLGRYDRPWGPERPVWGKVRPMTSASARRKFDLSAYLQRWLPSEPPAPAQPSRRERS